MLEYKWEYKWENITVKLYLNQILEYVWVRDCLLVEADIEIFPQEPSVPEASGGGKATVQRDVC